MAVDRLDQVWAALGVVFWRDVSIAVTDPKVPQPVLMASEQSAVARAVPSRQLEFAAGRAVARTAMRGLGVTPCALPAGEDRAPIWPVGVVGTISHTATACAAVVAHAGDWRGLGVDIEDAAPLNQELVSAICSDRELDRIKGRDQLRLAKLIFSAKEAAYKAQYPISKLLFGFYHLDITLNISDGSFTATFLKPAAPFRVGDTLLGRFAYAADVLVTGVVIGQDAIEGA